MTGFGEDRRSPSERRPRWGDPERRSTDLGAPPTPALGHLLDLVFFRLLGVALIANEVIGEGRADWHVLVAGFGAFFMPDWLRGKSSPFVRVALKTWADSASSKATHVADELEKDSRDQGGES